MHKIDIQSEYERLCNELKKAYSAPVWNSQEIDRIANAMARIEWSCVRRRIAGWDAPALEAPLAN